MLQVEKIHVEFDLKKNCSIKGISSYKLSRTLIKLTDNKFVIEDTKKIFSVQMSAFQNDN